MTAAIALEHVEVKRDGVSILEDITTSIPRGSVTAIIGPNGAGKTTLLFAILGLVPYTGRITSVSARTGGRPVLGYVPQRLDFDRGAPITVLDFLVMPLQRFPVWFGINKQLKECAMKSLTRVQADQLALRRLGKLSGGELQRVQLAQALQRDPEIVLLDEPVSGVDVSGERLFCDMLEQIQRESRLTLVLVSHDLSVVSRHCTDVICLNKRLQCAGPAPQVMNSANLAAIYGPHMGLYDHHAHHGCSHHHEQN